MASRISKDTSFFVLALDTKQPLISQAQVKQIKYKKPSGMVGQWDAVIEGNLLKYVFTGDELDELGIWSVQAYVEVLGQKGYGEIQQIEIISHL